MDLTPNHKLADFIHVERNTGLGFWRKATFPQILQDASTKNYIGIVTLQGERIEDPMVAFLLDLIKWGYENLETHSSLKTPLTEGCVLDTPNADNLPYQFRHENYQVRWSRPLHEFFAFSEERIRIPQKRGTLIKTVSSRTNFRLPSLCVGVRGYREAYLYQNSGTGFDAACIEAIQMGHRLTTCDNGIYNLEVDDTAERLAFLKGRMSAPDFPKVVEDSKWVMLGSSNPSRGIADYDRRVVFDAVLSAEQFSTYKEFLSLAHCPGQGVSGLRADAVSTTAYIIFSTTHDSSD